MVRFPAQLRCFLFLLLVSLTACQLNTTLPANTGYWSDQSFWTRLQMQQPQAGESVTIPANVRVILDQDPPPLAGLTVLGELEFARKNLHLSTDFLMVHGPGILRIGSEEQPFEQQASITLTGSDPQQNIMGMGAKFLGAMMGGKLELIGKSKTSWTTLNATAPQGSRQITLAQSVDWQVGDQIVIASSALDPHQAETRTVQAVSGTTLTLDRPFEFGHFGELQTIAGRTLDERAEVGLLSRNIVIEGDQNNAGGFGGHVMVMGSSPSQRENNSAMRSSGKIRGVEFRRLGQFNRLARYPFHWHYNGDSAGNYLEDSSFHSNFQRSIVVHGTDHVRVSRNVVYNSLGHSIMTEDGSEQGNSFESNLIILTRAFPYLPSNPIQVGQNDDQAASFWIKGPSNRFIGNRAAGGEFTAFWFDNVGAVDPAQFVFRQNVIHSYLVGQALGAPGSVDNKGALWITGLSSAPVLHGPFNLEQTLIYKTRSALWANPVGDPAGQVQVEMHDSVLADNAIAIGSHGLRDSLVVGKSANLDSDPQIGRMGVQEYGGTTTLQNVSFANFAEGSSALQTRNCFREGPNMVVQKVRLVNAQFKLCEGSSDVAIADLDGSLNGNAQVSTIVPAAEGSRAMYDSRCALSPATNARVCPGSLDYLNLSLETESFYRSYIPAAPSLLRDDDTVQSGSDITNAPFYWTLMQDHRYTLQTNLAQWQYLRLRLYPKYKNHDSSPKPAWVILPSNTATFSVFRCALETLKAGQACAGKAKLDVVESLAALESSNQAAYFFESASRQIHLKLFSNTDTSLLIER